MSTNVADLAKRINELSQVVEQSCTSDGDSDKSRQARRDLLKASRDLSFAMRNEGQIVEDYLYSVSGGCAYMLGRNADSSIARQSMCCC